MSSFEVYKDYPEIVHSIEMALKGELARTSSVVAGAYFDVSYSPYVDRFGQVIGVIGIASDVTERKLAEEAIQKRLVALTKPLSSIADIEFDELFNLDEIQKVQDSFANATGVASIITLPNGTPITQPSNFTRLCNDIIRTTEKGCENCYYSDSVVGRQNNDGPIIQPCLSCGLWDAGASITIAGKHIANWLIGQVRNSDIDEKKILNYAEVIGADKEEFKLALEEVPVMSYEQFEKISQALFIFANELSTKAYQNVQQARFIIEKQRTEDDLNKAYQKLNLHFEQAPIGVIEWNMEHKVINWNPSAEKIFGYTKQEAMGQHASFILPEGVRNLADEVFNGLLKQNGGKQVTNENIRKDGAILTCEWYNTALVDNNSKTIGFASLIQDITDRVNAEEALKAREKSFRVLYNNTPVMLHSIDNNGKLLSVSDFWLNAMGYERDEVLGRRSTEFLSEKSKKYALEVVLPEFMRTGECKNIEYQFVKKNGEIIEALMSAISEKDENGDIIRSLAVINDISIRKKTEELLRQSEQTYRGILDSINEAVYIESLDGYFIEVNKAAEKMYGYEREFFVGKTPEFLAAPGKNDLSQLKPILQKAVEGNPQTFEFWGKDKNGRIFPKEVSNTLGYYFGQKVIIAVARDITDRKQSEDSIKRLNRVYTVLSNINQTIVRIQDIQELFDKTCQIAIDDGDFKMAWIGMINEESQMVEIVAEAGNSLDYLQKVRDGITLEEISKYPVGRALTTGEHYFSNDIANDPDTEIIRESALANGFNSVVSLPIKIGGTTKGIFTLFAGENFFDEDEIKLLDELAMDISFALEFMEREKERKKVENALAESEMIFNSFMKYSPNYIFFKDSEIRTIRLSDNFEQWLGKPLEEMLNKTMYDLFPSELAKNIIEDDKRILNEGNVVTVDEEFGGRYYTTIKFPIYQDDKPIYIAGFTIDITERKLAEEEIRKLNSELEAKVIERTSTLQSTLEQLQESNLELNTLNKQVMKDSESILNLNEDLIISQEKLQEAITTKDKFFSIIAHDLRSPFAGFLLLSEMMSKDVDTLTIAEIKKMGLSINNSANALFKLLDSLLMWSRSQLGKIPYQPEQIDIYEIAHNAAVSMMGNAEAKQIQIIIDIKQPTLVLCDSNMMTTVFRNLLSNAIKFSKEGSIVRMDIEEMTDVLQISIKDNGVGLSQNKIDKLFKLDEHMTTKGTKGESGSGLGLVICKEFVEKHGGKIWVDSEEGKGSSFYFTLIKN
jgi:PAS domain S-box-containing protein